MQWGFFVYGYFLRKKVNDYAISNWGSKCLF